MSKIKVNTIAPRSGTTVTLGEAGDTIALGACASQTGFGRTGTVDWCTTVKTSPLTAVSGKGYMVNTCGGAVTVTLPSSPTAGDIVSLKDYKDTWGTACKAVTLGRGGSKIAGNCVDATLDTAGQSITMVYIDGTQGWLNIQTDTTVKGSEYICASGGNATVTCGDYKTHIFTATGTFTVNCTALSAPNNVVDYLVVAGGGGGGTGDGGAGGAGGFRYFSQLSPAGSPLVAPAGITVTATAYPITVGAGGAGGPTPSSCGVVGSNTVFTTITSAGGGFGGGNPSDDGGNGGSGGGSATGGSGGCGNTPPTSPPQGQNGGSYPGSHGIAQGGGGAGGVGGNGTGPNTGGAGGVGSYIPDGYIGPTAPSYGTAGPVSSTRYFSGGGGGYGDGPGGSGGAGGGGCGTGGSPLVTNYAGCANTGGGGGGGNGTYKGKTGGSGIVMIRYRYQ
jgi:hypothetical protein